VLQAELGCGRKFGRCAIGCSACWQNVDGGLGGTVSANGSWHQHQHRSRAVVGALLAQLRAHRSQCLSRAASDGCDRGRHGDERRHRSMYTNNAVDAVSAFGQLHWNPEGASREPVESSATRSRPLALSTAQVSNTKLGTRCLEAMAGSTWGRVAPRFLSPPGDAHGMMGFAHTLPAWCCLSTM
jgi:hypothetical protein